MAYYVNVPFVFYASAYLTTGTLYPWAYPGYVCDDPPLPSPYSFYDPSYPFPNGYQQPYSQYSWVGQDQNFEPISYLSGIRA